MQDGFSSCSLLLSVASTLLGCSASVPEIAAAEPVVPTGYTSHTPSPRDEAAAHIARCEAGHAVACHQAALDAYYSPASADTDARAATLFRKACDAGYAPSCNGLGVLHKEGRGLPKDDVLAASFFRAACEKDGSTGCEHFAAALERGWGVPRDAAAAARAKERGHCLFETSLKKGDAGGCPGLLSTPHAESE